MDPLPQDSASTYLWPSQDTEGRARYLLILLDGASVLLRGSDRLSPNCTIDVHLCIEVRDVLGVPDIVGQDIR